MFQRFTREKKARLAPRREEREVQVSDRAVPLLVTENARSKRLTLRIEPGGRRLRLTVPVGLPRAEVDRFLKRQEGWLSTRLARFEAGPMLAEGQFIAIRGKDHVIRRTGKLRGVTKALTQDPVAVLEVAGGEEHLKRRIRDYLKREARADLAAAVKRHTATIGRPARSITLKDTSSRWGSCTSDGALSFSWRIIMAPPHVIDYLAAHEVAHLLEMNHGPKFWALCRKLCPQTESAKAWLKKNGTLLHAVEFD